MMNILQRLLLKNRVVNLYEQEAEEKQCAMMWLDDMDVPRTDDRGRRYSLVGRIRIFEQQVRQQCKELREPK